MTDRNPFQLARLADCAEPDGTESVGAQWLAGVAYSFQLALEAGDLADEDTFGDTIAELADAAVPIYTHQRWQVFVDLAAYQEDLDGWEPADPTSAAGIALYQVAERLLLALHGLEVDGDE